MTDYNKLTVANLRQLLKDRGIPSTGLTRKAQIIEKLEEHEKANNGSPAEPEATPAAAQPDATEAAKETQDEAAPAIELVTSASAAPDPALESGPEPPTQTESPPVPETTTREQAEEQSMPTEPTAHTEDAEAPLPASEERPLPTVSEPTPERAQASQVESQTPTMDTAMDEKTPSPDPNEKPSVEKAELLPIPEQSANTTTAASRLNTEELEADNRKRKRRSHSPDLPLQDIRAKKARASDDVAPEVHLKEDADTVMEQRLPEPEPEIETVVEDSKEEPKEEPKEETKEETKEESKDESKDESKPIAQEKKEKAPRYKDLFQPNVQTSTTDLPLDDRPMIPALHPATPAIYIRNFMRPLRPEPLRAHLVSLASPPSADPDPSILKSLFLDSMKTHALVLFTTTTAASRVRASLHGSIWPAEGNRKELWVDFVPENHVGEWIQNEEDAIAKEKEARAAGHPIATKRFEVVYPETEDGVKAVFQEVGSGASSAPLNAPRGPKSNVEQRRNEAQLRRPLPIAPDESTKKDLGQSFHTLDSLFESTTAKPKLYYLPVDDDRSSKRRDEMDKETSRNWRPEDKVRGRGSNRVEQKMKYSFDKDDRLVEVDVDYGPWSEDSGGFRGGRGGRGVRGGGWRGGGGGFRGGRGSGGGWRG